MIKEDGTLKVTSRKIRLKDNGISEFLEDLKRIEKESAKVEFEVH